MIGVDGWLQVVVGKGTSGDACVVLLMYMHSIATSLRDHHDAFKWSLLGG